MLDAVVPDGYRVRSIAGWLAFVPPQHGLTTHCGVASIFEDASTPEEGARSAAFAALNCLQDVVALSSTEPWPVDVTAGRNAMADVQVVLTGDELKLWYGSAEREVLPVGVLDVRAFR